jgi:hypothetical protein
MTHKHIFAGLLLGCTVALTACTGDRQHRQDDAYDIFEPVAALAVTSWAGDVVVTASERDSIRVVQTLRWRGSDNGRPRAEHTVSHERLQLLGTCAVHRDGCAVDYRIEVPRNLRVSIQTQTGDLAVHGVAGELVAVTGAGDIRADGLSAPRAQVDSGAGDVDLAFLAAPQQVGIDTDSGDVTLRLPAGPYQVTARAEGGDRIVEVGADAAATRSVTARSGAGDVRLLPA